MNTPKHALYAFLAVFLLVLTPFVTACSETDEDTTIEWTDWAARNEAYFLEQMATARAAIAQAQAAYGDQWEAHCDWRVYKNYRLAVDDPGTAFDSICVQIVNRGTGSGCPLYTDSVRINYRGSLMPNPLSEAEVYRKGYVFAFSGPSRDFDDVFSPVSASPQMFRVSELVQGFGTALMYMHIGDLWRVYIPANLGYGTTGQTYIPASSTLIYEIELKAYYRAGTTPPEWH